MKLKMCNCKYCRWVRHRSKWERYKINHAKKSARQKVKILLRKGEFDKLPEAIWIPYNG
jgi:hypothetical protein